MTVRCLTGGMDQEAVSSRSLGNIHVVHVEYLSAYFSMLVTASCTHLLSIFSFIFSFCVAAFYYSQVLVYPLRFSAAEEYELHFRRDRELVSGEHDLSIHW